MLELILTTGDRGQQAFAAGERRSRANFAVLLPSALAGVHAFRIDTNGAVAPFQSKMQN